METADVFSKTPIGYQVQWLLITKLLEEFTKE